MSYFLIPKDGFPVPSGLTYTSVQHGAHLLPNSHNVITAGSNSGTVTLPLTPAPGTIVEVYRQLATNILTNNTLVAPTSPDTIEGTASTGVALRLPASYVSLTYDGVGNWWIGAHHFPSLSVFVTFGAGGNSSPIAGGSPFYVPRSGSFSFNIASAFLPMAVGNINLDCGVQAPFFSAGTVTITPQNLFITNSTGTNKVLSVYGGANFNLTSHASCSPGSGGMPLLTNVAWTNTITGTDLSVDAAGASYDSAAGGVYQAYFQCNVLLSNLIP